MLLMFIFIFLSPFSYAEEEEVFLRTISDQLQALKKDVQTLEKAVYQKTDSISTNSNSTSQLSNGLNEDILTKHLLKLNEIENQFRELTNKFEEVYFKLDKLSSRVTKIQSDSQLRFSDLENSNTENKKTKKKIFYQDLVSRQTLVQIQDIQFLIYPTNNKQVLSKVLKQ